MMTTPQPTTTDRQPAYFDSSLAPINPANLIEGDTFRAPKVVAEIIAGFVGNQSRDALCVRRTRPGRYVVAVRS